MAVARTGSILGWDMDVYPSRSIIAWPRSPPLADRNYRPAQFRLLRSLDLLRVLSVSVVNLARETFHKLFTLCALFYLTEL